MILHWEGKVPASQEKEFPWIPLANAKWALLPVSTAPGFRFLQGDAIPHSQEAGSVAADITWAFQLQGGSPFL